MLYSLIAWPFTIADHLDSGVWIKTEGINEKVRRSAHVVIDIDEELGEFSILAFRSHPAMVGKQLSLEHLDNRIVDNEIYMQAVDFRGRVQDRYEDVSKVNPLKLEDDSYVHYLHEAAVNKQLLTPDIAPHGGF